MLVSMEEVLSHAHEEGYAVAAPNVHSEIEARTALETAEEANAPLILDVAFFLHPDIVFFGSYLTRLCEEALVPVAINLDHGGTLGEAVAAIRAGFTGVMVDRSSLPFEENCAQVREIVRIAHSVGVSVEAELGHVGETSSYDPHDASLFTRPEEALRFVEETEVDSLAIAIGTSHGLYKGVKPELDFALLERITETVDVPLVLHGGSGTGREDLRRACSSGINKVNVYSELLQGAYEEIAKADIENEPGFLLYRHIQDGYKARLAELVEVFGSQGKGFEPTRRGLASKRVAFDAGQS